MPDTILPGVSAPRCPIGVPCTRPRHSVSIRELLSKPPNERFHHVTPLTVSLVYPLDSISVRDLHVRKVTRKTLTDGLGQCEKRSFPKIQSSSDPASLNGQTVVDDRVRESIISAVECTLTNNRKDISGVGVIVTKEAEGNPRGVSSRMGGNGSSLGSRRQQSNERIEQIRAALIGDCSPRRSDMSSSVNFIASCCSSLQRRRVSQRIICY